MNFIEDAKFPHGSDSLRKECKTASKTSPGGSKTTFLPIKLQQSIIQAAMYAASASVYKIEAKGKDLCEVQFFGKFIMCSNNEDTPVLIEPGETRYWVRKINPLKK